MPIRQDTLWEQFLSPLIRGLLDKEQMLALRDRIEWQDTIDRYQPPAFGYPDYYHIKQAFPGAVVTGLDFRF